MATTMPSNKINSSEDHMDLGPFLQEYVLRNPFNPLCEPTKAPPRVPSRDSNHDSTSQPAEAEVTSSDVVGGHIGSNVGFAHQLKEMRLPRRHAKVRQWLLQHYKYASFYSGWVSSDALLKEVKGPFDDMKSNVLSRIIKFTYPECRKVINRYGYFYMGLIKRPTAAEFQKENLLRAAKEVNKNANNVSSVAVKHEVDSFQLASVYIWLEEGPLPDSETRRGRRSVTTEISEKDESEWHPDEDDIDENEDANKPLPRLRSLRKRTRNAVLGYLRAKLQPVGREDDTSDDNEQNETSDKKRRKNGTENNNIDIVKKEHDDDQEKTKQSNTEDGDHQSRTPIKIGEVITVKQEPCDDYFAFKSMTDSDESTTGFSGRNTSDECEAIDMSKKRLMQDMQESSKEKKDANINNNDELGLIKEENDRNSNVVNFHPSEAQCHSPGFDNSDSNSLHSNSQKSNSSPKVALDSLVGRLRASLAKEPEADTNAAQFPNNANVTPNANVTANANVNVQKANDVNAIADSLKYRQELEIVRKDLAIREEENYRLQQDLRSSRQEMQELKEKFVMQNTLLSDLSSEFYDLSNHFMKVSHHFKTVVTEVQRASERL